jgi:hypothetical protein
MESAAGSTKSAMARDVQPASAADVSARSKVDRRTIAVRVVGDSYAVAIGAGLKVDGVSSADRDVAEKGVAAGTEVRGAARSIWTDFDAGRDDTVTPDFLEAPAPLIGRAAAIERQRRIAPESAGKLHRFGIDKAWNSTPISAVSTARIHALILTRTEIAGDVRTGSLARSSTAYVIAAIPTREVYRDGGIAVGVTTVGRLNALTAIATPTRVNLI